ncbi:hypothetical protein [Methyloceanibacter sp.]|uniref:hypothetical protein n=1 Tax=Methyloceanibacter sp. TaxID=1965321 RepID=UPI003D6D6EC1
MWRSFKTMAATALIGASIACALASPALAAKPASGRHYAHHDIYGTPARYASRIFRCHGGRHYTDLDGWGCDYYLYSYAWPYGRRR